MNMLGRTVDSSGESFPPMISALVIGGCVGDLV